MRVQKKEYTIQLEDWAATFEEDGSISWRHEHPENSRLHFVTPWPWQDGCRRCGQKVPKSYEMMVKLQHIKGRKDKGWTEDDKL